MSYKHTMAYFPHIIKIYENMEQLFEENNLNELKNIALDIAERNNATRVEYVLHPSKTYFIGTVEYPSIEDYLASISDSLNYMPNISEMLVEVQIDTHLF